MSMATVSPSWRNCCGSRANPTPFGCTGHDDITGVKGIELRAKFDELSDGKDEVISIVLLSYLAINRGGQTCATTRSPFIRSGEPRSKAGGAIK